MVMIKRGKKGQHLESINVKKFVNCCKLILFIWTDIFFNNLESQLREEPLVLTSLVSFFESLLDDLLGFFTLGWFFESFGRDNGLEGLNIQGVSGWKQVVVVDGLDEWLDLSSLSDLLSTVLLGNLQWVSFNTGNQSMGKWVSLGTFIVRLHDDNLLTGVTTTDDDSNLTSFQELSHSVLCMCV